MDKLPLLTAKQLYKILEKNWFYFVRQKWSHMFFKHENWRTTVIPNHPWEQIDRWLLNKIIKYDLRLDRYEFIKSM